MLWNASTGAHTTQYDPHCPLTSVGCIINCNNVSLDHSSSSLMKHRKRCELHVVVILWNAERVNVYSLYMILPRLAWASHFVFTECYVCVSTTVYVVYVLLCMSICTCVCMCRCGAMYRNIVALAGSVSTCPTTSTGHLCSAVTWTTLTPFRCVCVCVCICLCVCVCVCVCVPS